MDTKKDPKLGDKGGAPPDLLVAGDGKDYRIQGSECST